MIQWTNREIEGVKTTVEGLGTVEIFQSGTNQGRVVFINGKQAWGGCRGTMEEVKFRVGQDIQRWQYLSSFIPTKEL